MLKAILIFIIQIIVKTVANNECYSLGELSVYYEPECSSTIFFIFFFSNIFTGFTI